MKRWIGLPRKSAKIQSFGFQKCRSIFGGGGYATAAVASGQGVYRASASARPLIVGDCVKLPTAHSHTYGCGCQRASWKNPERYDNMHQQVKVGAYKTGCGWFCLKWSGSKNLDAVQSRNKFCIEPPQNLWLTNKYSEKILTVEAVWDIPLLFGRTPSFCRKILTVERQLKKIFFYTYSDYCV